MMAQLFNGNEDIWNVLWQSDHFHVHYFLSLGLICWDNWEKLSSLLISHRHQGHKEWNKELEAAPLSKSVTRMF